MIDEAKTAAIDKMPGLEPADPLQASSHVDPYPYYARLRAGPPLVYDATVNQWVASRAAVLDELFAHPGMRVRPADEAAPAAIAGKPAGEVFARLVRMNEGAGHQPGKRVIEQALAGASPCRVQVTVGRIATSLLPRVADPDGLNRWLFDVPVRSVAALLGFGDASLNEIASATRAFVACLSPLSSPEQLSAAHAAAIALGEAMMHLAEEGGNGIAAELRIAAKTQHWADTRAITANLVGLLSQTYEATAGLIGNCLVALHHRPGALEPTPEGLLRAVRETARFDSPVQNTRRFAAEAVTIGGVDLPHGAPVLLLLAAANRDPLANPNPDVFDLQRTRPRLYSFSRGVHACPGQELAHHIAATALYALHVGGSWAHGGKLRWSYKPSANARLPVFHQCHLDRMP